MASGFGSKPFNAPMLPDFSAGMPTVASGGQVLPSQEIVLKTPMDIFKDVFFDIRKGIDKLVQQSKEALGLQKEEDREKDIKQSLSPDDRVSDEKTDGKSILDSLKENLISPLTQALSNVTIG